MVAERITVEVAALSNSCEPLIAPPGDHPGKNPATIFVELVRVEMGMMART